MDIKYKVEFFTDWHCGSGLAAGADVDALVIKDSEGLPYIPGKTMKGLLREAAEEIISFRYGSENHAENPLYQKLIDAFGIFDEKTNEMKRGDAFFTNAELPEEEKKTIISEDLRPYIYRTLSSTAVDTDGIAIDHSLRRIEVAVPCTLYGSILGLPDDEELKNLMADALKYVKRLGQNRNRGLGRCALTAIEATTSVTLK